MFTKKSLISLAASALLCGNVYASSNTVYVPLSTDSYDARWVMFGVNGFSDGVSSSSGGGATFTSTTTQLIESAPTDDAASYGIADSGANGNLASVQALSGATTPLAGLTVAVDVTGIVFSSTEPVRTMYIDATGEGEPDIKFEYKASLEGKTIEIQKTGTSDTSIYSTTISELNTWDNAATVSLATPAVSGTDVISLNNVLDYDLSNNPATKSTYSSVTNKDTAPSGTTARFYTYDSVNQTWKLYDTGNTAIANDFSTLEKGRGYWGKIDIGGDVDGSTQNAGLILGSSGETTKADATVYANNLNDGWNLISFDDVNSKIIHASTGLIATTADNNLDILDSTLTHMVTIDIDGDAGDALKVNKALDAAKNNGTISSDMNIRAFQKDATHLVLLSDKKFTIKGSGSTGAITIAGQNAWNETTHTTEDLSGTMPADGISSVYGEYAMIIKPLLGVNTAAQIDKVAEDASAENNAGTHRSAAIQVGSNSTNLVYLAPNDGDSAIATLEANFELNDAFKDDTVVDTSKGLATQIDMDFDGATASNELLLAATEPFYIKDHTFTKTYVYDGTAQAHGATFKMKSVNNSTDSTLSNASVTITPSDTTIATTVDLINETADANTITAVTDTGVFAYDEDAVSSNKKIILVSATDPYFSIKDSASAVDGYVLDSDSVHNVAKGAISSVYSIDKLVTTQIVPNKFVITGFELPNDAGDKYGAKVGATTTNATAMDTILESDTTKKKALFDDLVAAFNTSISTEALSYAVASHNYTEVNNPSAASVSITIEGYGIASADTTEVADTNNDNTLAITGTDANVATLNTISGLSADLSTDIKFNPVYTPTYVTDGPIATLKEAGFLPKAIISASTDLHTATASAGINWTNIDLTKTNSDWFNNNEYNLFNISNSQGYWVYLESAYTAPTIAITNPIFTPTFTYSFNVDNSTVNNLIGGQFTTEVSFVPDSSTKIVKAIIDGKKLDLISSGNNYTAMFTKYETSGIAAGNDESISVIASNGFGDSITESGLTTIDYTKPSTPTVTIENGIATLVSTSTDVAKYYYFETFIPEESTASSAKDAASYNICAEYPFGSTTALKAVAVDNNGLFGSSNVSDALSFNYENTVRGAYVLEHTYDATGATVSQTGDMYNDTCMATPDTNNYGMSLKTIKIGATAKLSFPANTTVHFDNSLPITQYFSVDAISADVQIKSVLAYDGKAFYLQLDGTIYKGAFGNTDGTTSTNLGTLTVVTSQAQTF